MSSTRYGQHQAPSCVTGPAERAAELTIGGNDVAVSGCSLFTWPQTTIIVTEKRKFRRGDIGGQVDREMCCHQGRWITELVIPFDAKMPFSQGRAGRKWVENNAKIDEIWF